MLFAKWTAPRIFSGAALLVLAGCAGGGGGDPTDVWQGAPGDPQMQQQAVAKSDHLIVPGDRVGPIRLGMAMDEVTNILGPSPLYYINRGDRLQINTTLKYPALNLTVTFDTSPTPTVTSITYAGVTPDGRTLGSLAWSDIQPAATNFHSAGGLTVGSTSFDASRLYGEYSYNSPIDMNFKAVKMYLLVTNDHRVWSISVNKE